MANLSKLVRQYSAGLASIGLRPEARMLLFGTDSLDYVLIWLAAVRLGAIPVVVSDLYKPRELLYFLADTGVGALFIDSEQVPKLVEIAKDVPASLKTIVVRGGGALDAMRHFPRQSVVDLARDCFLRHSRPMRPTAGTRMTSPTCSIPAAPPAPPRVSPISPTTSFWFPSGTAGSGNIPPPTWCSRPRKSISPTACGPDC